MGTEVLARNVLRKATVATHHPTAIPQLPFERSFARWCVAQGVVRRSVRYRRERAQGEAWGHQLVPVGERRGGALVVHGAGNDAFFALTGLFTSLLQRGIEVFSFDVDGHGRGSSTLLSPVAAPTCIASALDAWSELPGGAPEQLHAIGISLGGALLLHALREQEARIGSASLLCTPLSIEFSGRAMRREMGRSMLRTVWRERRRVGLTGLIPSFGPFRRDLYPLRLSTPPGAGGFAYVDALNELLTSLELEDAARSTGVPVLLIYGRRDLLVPPEQAERLHELLPTSQLLVLEDETHLSTPLAPEAIGRLLQGIDRHQSIARQSA